MNNRFGNSSTKEQDIPDSLRSNSKWLKNLYGELSSAKPVGISEKKRLESLLSDFNTEAENIGKLDSKTRDLPHIQEYMKNKYGKSHIFGSSEGIIGSQGKSNAPDNSGKTGDGSMSCAFGVEILPSLRSVRMTKGVRFSVSLNLLG